MSLISQPRSSVSATPSLPYRPPFPQSQRSFPAPSQPQSQQSHPLRINQQQRRRWIAAYLSALEHERAAAAGPATGVRFSEVFTPKAVRLPKPVKKPPPRLALQANDAYYDVTPDVLFSDRMPASSSSASLRRSSVFRPIRTPQQQHPTNEPQLSSPVDEQDREIDSKSSVPLQPVTLDTWENRILWEDDDSTSVVPTLARPTEPSFVTRNHDIEDGVWLSRIVWDDTSTPLSFAPPLLTQRRPILLSTTDDHRYNLSNDEFYETANKSARFGRVRVSQGPIVLRHSDPANRLMMQYFKPQLTVEELRSFHRPSFTVQISTEVRFSRVKGSKKKHKKKAGKGADGGDSLAQLIKTPQDLSVRDTSKYVLLEYSEEYPQIMNNTGMGSLIINYYRKRDEKDAYVPQLDVGAPVVLEQVDATPFNNFGDVKPGQTITALYNNLIRAPVFRQKPIGNDYLLVRVTEAGGSVVRYFLREIGPVFVVGQTYPQVMVPRPQSRKIVQTAKGRLKATAVRLMRKSQRKRLRFDKLMRYFPGQSEGQVRQRLKEFAQFQRKGENVGWWRLKDGMTLPSEDELRKLVSPEDVCLYESMQVGEQRLRDAGYGSSLPVGEGADDDDAAGGTNEIEVELAPWTTTKNFVMASQGKGMLKLFGPGDPTGRGEGFSFIRASMKEMFFRAGENVDERTAELRARPSHRFSIAEQQQVYKEEIDRIWTAQLKTLSSTADIVLTDDEDQADDDLPRKSRMDFEDDDRRVGGSSGGPDFPFSNVSSPGPFSPASMGGPDGDVYSDAEQEDSQSVAGSVMGGASSTSHGAVGAIVHGGGKGNKHLVINRLVKGEWKAEIVTDPRVINSYLRQRRIIEARDQETEGVPLTEDEERRRRKYRTKEQLGKLNQKQEQRKGATKRRGEG
ncbi:hypothetical protein BJ742DRAFT_795086 [Cladochytrium replicatum]|nr:hypothetical protein BJ742DRAFT_795086 [Cladochytrium replicatum]